MRDDNRAGTYTIFGVFGALAVGVALAIAVTVGVALPPWPVVVAALAWLSMPALGAYVAHAKGRPIAEGVILGMLFGPLGVVVGALLPNVGIVWHQEYLRRLQSIANANHARLAVPIGGYSVSSSR